MRYFELKTKITYLRRYIPAYSYLLPVLAKKKVTYEYVLKMSELKAANKNPKITTM